MNRFVALAAGAALVAAGAAFAADAPAKKEAPKADPAKGQAIATQVCVASPGSSRTISTSSW